MVDVTHAGGTINTISTIGEIGELGKISAVEDVKIRSYPCPKVSNKGLIESWSWTQAASVVISAASAYVAYKTAKDQYDIADRYWRLARDEWDFFYDNYRPLEEQELREIWKEGKYEADYESAITGHTSPVDNIVDKAENHRRNLQDKYCMCPDAGIARQFAIAENTITGDLDNFARRYAENNSTMLNDRRRNRRLAAANRGRDLLSKSTSFAAKANAEYADYAASMTNLAQGAAEYAQYLATRRPTRYNGARDRIDTRITPAFDGDYSFANTNYQFTNPQQPIDNSYNYTDVMTDINGMNGLDSAGITGYNV